MVLLIFSVGCFLAGSALQVAFRRFSWPYVLVSMVISVGGLLAARSAIGEIRPPFPPLLSFIEQLIAWNLGPWLIFAFLPLQLGFVSALVFRLHCGAVQSPGKQ